MTWPQIVAFAILAATLGLFVWGRWRYDVVAVFALLVVVLTGLVPAAEAFNGFAHSAVITVIAVLIISRGLLNAGLVDGVVKAIAPLRGRENLQLAAQCIVIALLSAFMNNVGALALMLPVALRNAYRDGYPPAKTLMPLAFASLLGGLVTLIGTPPNIIVSSFRASAAGQQFGMFDFTPVGLAVAAAGLLFLILLGWRLIPINRSSTGKDAFQIENYISEALIPEDSKAVGLTVFELEELVDEGLVIAGIVRDGTRRLLPAGRQRLRSGDVLVLRGNAAALKSALDAGGLTLVGDRDFDREELRSKEIELVEAVISPNSPLLGTSPTLSRLRSVYGINLLAVAREGHAIEERLDSVRFHSGDVLLLQGPRADMSDVLARLGCLPLAGRDLGLDRRRRLALAGGAFAIGIGCVVANAVPVHIGFMAVVAVYVATGIVRVNELYTSIDWPVIVLLGAMFPVGAALETTGGTSLIAAGIVSLTEGYGHVAVLAVLLVATMCISDVINNNATAVLMAPIAITIADRLGTTADPYLMAVAVGSSCAFLTPIGHQSNTLVMEPGGYKFGDYWRVGLPLEIVIVAVALPMILIIWPP